MTLPELLSEIAYTGKRGLNPFTLQGGQESDVQHLMSLGLVAIECNGNLCACVEKGAYPVINSFGVRTYLRSERPL